ncbi:MAG: His/Gly/Thr/Pro-type tRNA ligase C-terminal domain-containing protein, partial [Acidobacteriota bacterium]
GLGSDTYVTFASGGAFTKFSHEFQTVCDAGEDVIYLHRGKNIAVNEEVLDDAVAELGVDKSELEPVKTAEVGNIFNFGTQKGEEMGLFFTDANGEKQPVYLGSYGIGVTRVMGVIAEKFADDKGLVWPENIAPMLVYLVSIGDVQDEAQQLYDQLRASGVEVLWDDRDVRPGEKFADADLMGLPHRIVVSPKTLEQRRYEYKARTSDESRLVGSDELFELLAV